MMQTILYNEHILKRFVQIIKTGHLAHAYLFVGPLSAGKSETALTLAKLVNCEKIKLQEFCDACPSCIKINSGNHPDVQTFEAITKEEEDAGFVNPKQGEKLEKNKSRTIRINQVRYISAQSQLRAFEGTKKVFIIKNIEDLSDDAANAFLKTLEEPSKNSLIILTSMTLQKVLDTVKSRCQIVHFFPLSNDHLENKLVADHHLDKKRAHFLAYLSEGSLGRAIRLNETKTFERKNDTINNFVYTQNSDPFIQTLTADKEKIKESLDILLTWFRDLMLLKSHIDELKLIHSDRLQDLKTLAPKFSFKELEDAVDEILSVSRLLEENLNMKIALTLLKEKLWKK